MRDATNKKEFWDILAGAVVCDGCPCKSKCKSTPRKDDEDRCKDFLQKFYEGLDDE